MGILSSYKKFYSWAVTFSKDLKKEKDTWVPMPFGARFRMWTHGFWSVTHYRYDFNKFRISDYISDYQDNLRWIKLDNSNNLDWLYLDNKVLFPTIITHLVQMPENIALVLDRRMIPLSKDHPVRNIDDLVGYLQTNSVIIKPVDGLCGIGVFALELQGGRILLDSKPIQKDELNTFLLSLHNSVMCTRIGSQSDYSRELYPDTLNTLRILTLRDPDKGEAFIAGAVQRIGTSYSYPVDNFHRGGIAANVNLDTGELGKAAAIFPVSNNRLNWHEYHPDTKAKIVGRKIPNWDQLKLKVLELADEMSFCRIIGWDIASTAEGFILIEANNGADPKIHQIHEPLLINPRVRRFCEFYKII
jgi:hypothetical protein